MTIDEIIDRNKQAGNSFFDSAQMHQWHSRVSSIVHEGPGGIFFVTSEPQYDGVRRRSVRRFVPETGAVKTTAWGKYETNAEAQRQAKKFSRDPGLDSDERSWEHQSPEVSK